MKRTVRRAGALLACWVALVCGLAACGTGAQTLQPYTPAMGVNVDVGEGAAVKVLNLLVVSRAPGQGFVSASVLAESGDALVGLSGVSVTQEGPGAPLESDLTEPVPLPADEMVVLTELPLIQLTGPDLVAGTSARLELRFREAGTVALRVPIYRNQSEFVTVRPEFPTTVPS